MTKTGRQKHSGAETVVRTIDDNTIILKAQKVGLELIGQTEVTYALPGCQRLIQ